MRAIRADLRIIADPLGAAPAAVLGLAGAGFDYRLGSVAWWDMREPWFLDQERALAPVAPSLELSRGSRAAPVWRRPCRPRNASPWPASGSASRPWPRQG
ncbi:MAG: hypothetical protein R3D25_19490 [Geminicoccaceae bacterium]